MSNEEKNVNKKKGGIWKYLLYIIIILVATTISLISSLWGEKFTQVVDVFKTVKWTWTLILFGVVCFTYLLEAIIIKIFCRLYTRKYSVGKGIATTMIGAFYNNVTPGASGGQVMQAYTMKRQGIQISNAASIMVMWFILYQTSLVIFDVVTLGVEWKMFISMKDLEFGNLKLPMIPLIIVGFIINISIIGLLFIMSYSRKIHNFILHHVIGFLGKIRILKYPDKTRENLRVQVENFKIELRRLQANVPVVILVVLLFLILLFIRFAIPFLSAMSIEAFGSGYKFSFKDLADSSFLGAFHQMCAGLIPLPGQAGVSEYFFYYIYHGLFESISIGVGGKQMEANINATQILWRTMTFHIVLVVSGFVAAFYRGKPSEEVRTTASRQTFVDLQLSTFDERKRSSDTLYETRQLSRKEIQKKLSANLSEKRSEKREKDKEKEEKVEWEELDIDL